MATLFEIMREAIAQRCRQIVTVFNGLFDFEVDPDTALSGEISGEHALIHSTGGRVLSPQLESALKTKLHLLVTGSTWLEIEQDDDEQAMRETFESANLLVWHELCHLADPAVAREALKAVPLPAEANKVHAREVVIDALAMLMGRIMYAHPVTGQSIPRTDAERNRIMCIGLSALTRRICRTDRPPSASPNKQSLILRLAAELEIHVLNDSREAAYALKLIEQVWKPVLGEGRAIKEAYSTLYGYTLSMTDVTNLKFRPSLSSWTGDESEEPLLTHHTLH